MQRRALLNGPVARADGGVDFQVGLSLVLLELSVVRVRDSTFIQALVVLAHPRDLQLVGDVIALDLDCLWRERDKSSHELTNPTLPFIKIVSENAKIKLFNPINPVSGLCMIHMIKTISYSPSVVLFFPPYSHYTLL